VLATVNKDKITLDDLLDKIRKDSIPPEDSLNDPTYRNDLINKLVIDKLVLQQAAKYDWKKDSSFQAQRQDYMTGFALTQMYNDKVAGFVTVTDQEIEDHYQENKETIYKQHEQVRVSHILIEPVEDNSIAVAELRSQKADQQALEKSKQVLRRAQKEDFAELATTFSTDITSKVKGGDLGFKRRGELLPAIDSAVFTAQPGQMLGPFKSQFGYHVIKLTERSEEGYLTFDDKLKLQIRDRLKSNKENARNKIYVDSLRSAAAYTFNEEILAMPETSRVDDSSWCLIINDSDTLRAKEIWTELLRYKTYKKSPGLTIEEKENFIRNESIWAQLGLLRQTARESGYFNTPSYRKEEKNFALLKAKERIAGEAVPPYQPSQEDIIDYYESHPDLYTVEYPLHVQHIIFDDSVVAEAVRDSIVQGADFVDMAKSHYHTTGEEGIPAIYELGFIGPREMPEGFYEAASRLEPGEVSHACKTYLGYHLIKLVERKKDLTVRQVGPEISRILVDNHQRKALGMWEARMKSGAKIKVFSDKLLGVNLSKELKNSQKDN
ncbi:MAG: peptidylprolyl isomerase, partial [candidate division Zixibacteria bacterium]|nr:peptidylprolyl isomerase [candidate division Zixibacteria bacterium]